MEIDDSEVIFALPSKVEQCKHLLTLLNIEYFDIKDNWRIIGQCVKNVCGTKGFELFKKYTPEAFQPDLETMWSKLKKTRHGINSLKWLASKHKPEDFEEWVSDQVCKAALGALKVTAGTTQVADIVKFMYGHIILCSSIGKNETWFSFNGSCWERMSQSEVLKQKFSRKIAPIFEGLYEELMGEDDEEGSAMAKKAAFITRGLRDPGGKAALAKECSETMLIRNFEKEADEDMYILGMPNGVLDMRDFKNIHKRDALPDDWITLQTGGCYYPEIHNWDHPDVKYIMDFKTKIITEDDIREFSLLHRGSCLMGGNKDKYGVINIGETAHNGKTTDASYDRHVFGTYSGKMPIGAVSSATPKMNETNPALAATKGTRLQQFDEVSKKQEFNPTLFKLSCGNDEVWARSLYSNGCSFKPQFNIIFSCNSAPTRIDSAGDAGMDERTVLVPHTSRFVTDAPLDEAEQWRTKTFKGNPHILNDLMERADAGLWVYVQFLIKYLEVGLKKPKSVIDKTEQYKLSNNPYKQFLHDKLEKTKKQTDYVTLSDVYANYKIWFSETYPGKRLENRESFLGEIVSVLCEPVGDDKRFHGFKSKTDVKKYERR